LDGNAFALWIACALYFSSSIFTVRLRLHGQEAFRGVLQYFGAAAGTVALIWALDPAVAFLPGVALVLAAVKAGAYASRLKAYRAARLHTIGYLESGIAVLVGGALAML
jgi:hypothetical protein